MPEYIIQTTQEFSVTYRVTAESPDEAWTFLTSGFAENEDQSPGPITGHRDDASIEIDPTT